MAAFVKQGLRFPRPLDWLDRLGLLLARELAPSSEKIRTALRIASIGTIGGGIVAASHVNNELGTYIVWLLVGAGPMMSTRWAGTFLTAEALALVFSDVMARALAETPWLTIPFLFVLVSFSTYLGTIHKLGAALLLIQVTCLDIFYLVVFTPQQIGWFAAGAFGGSVITFGVLVVFDNWLWPDRAEPRLMESLGASLARMNARFRAASSYYLKEEGTLRPRLPPPTSDLPTHMTLLDQVTVEGVSGYRHAVLLAAITRVARIGLEVDRLIVATREDAQGQIRGMMRIEIREAVNAIAEVLDELARELPTHIAVGADNPPPPSRMRAKAAMDALGKRILEARPIYLKSASTVEIANFVSFADSLATLTGYIERLLDEPPQPSDVATSTLSASRSQSGPDPAMASYSFKVGGCIVIGYLIGLISQRADLSTILITVLITALPTYGASLHKMILRIIGAIAGGAVSLLAIIIVSPNFETLPAYLLVLFLVFYFSAYLTLTSGRIAYAGKQIGTTFAIVFAGLSPSVDIYGPLWRIWGILLGTFVVALIFFVVLPVYAADSLMPRLRKVIRDTLSLVPGGSASDTEDAIQTTNSETMVTLAEILQVADDARLEGRSSGVNHHAIVDAAGTLRRIANRLSSIATGRILTPSPKFDPDTESARQEVLNAIRRQLMTWLDFFNGPHNLDSSATWAIAQAQPLYDLTNAFDEFSSRLEEGQFARMESWTLEQRRAMLAELRSMRRLESLFSELNRYLADIPGRASQRASHLTASRPSSSTATVSG